MVIGPVNDDRGRGAVGLRERVLEELGGAGGLVAVRQEVGLVGLHDIGLVDDAAGTGEGNHGGDGDEPAEQHPDRVGGDDVGEAIHAALLSVSGMEVRSPASSSSIDAAKPAMPATSGRSVTASRSMPAAAMLASVTCACPRLAVSRSLTLPW